MDMYSSLSYVFSLNKLSEDRTAEILVELCNSMGVDKIASTGKLLFFGTHILSTSEAKKKLKPIRDMLASSYERDDGSISGKDIVKRSQIAMGEAAYRAAVAAAGKNQQSLTEGWEVLGLDEETATRIYEEVKKEGFVTGKVAKYGSANVKYDDKGNIVDKSDKPSVDGGEGTKEGEKGRKKESASGSVYECGECGYTLFIAQGRDFRFFGEDFKCPECGAAKDKFVSVDSEE
jgi:rubredoxin